MRKNKEDEEAYMEDADMAPLDLTGSTEFSDYPTIIMTVRCWTLPTFFTGEI